MMAKILVTSAAALRLSAYSNRACVTSAVRRSGLCTATSSASSDLVISSSCLGRLKELNHEEAAKKMLRLVVEGGGCSGFQYKFELDDQLQSDDKVFGEDTNARVVIDEVSLSLVRGATIDYHTELIRAAFRVVGNPQSEAGCSCGASFSIKI